MPNDDPLRIALDAVASAQDASVERIVALDALHSLSEKTLRAEVVQARASGVTWAVIGHALGVTRQAAFQRFGSKSDEKGEVVQRTLLVEAPKRAEEIVRGIAEARPHAVIDAHFGEEAAAVLTEQKLAEVWRDLTASFGEWEGFGAASAIIAGEYVVAETRLEFEAGSLTCRASWSADGKLAGLFFLPIAE